MSTLTNFTGPITPEGKDQAKMATQQVPFFVGQETAHPAWSDPQTASSMNALKHGFSSTKIIVMPGQEDDFTRLQADLTAEVRPEGALELTLFHHLLRDAWTLHRVELRQVEMAQSGRDPFFDPDSEKEFDRLERYHARYQSSFHKSLRELRTLQTNRIVQSLLPQPLGLGSLPATVKATEIVALAKRTHKYWNAMAINTLIAATKRSKASLSTPAEPKIILPEVTK